ncbi:hypothetical protein ABE755_002155 [Escherichia coli]|nr:hypothetical protein [Escherichia coli]EGO7119420.1 hypothetical protein [Salmonella enterica]
MLEHLEHLDNEYLNFTNRRYRIFEDGTLYDYKENCKVPVIIEDNNSYVIIDWYRGVGKYELGMIMLTAFDRIHIPNYLYDEIESLFIDNDPTNFSYSNHIYRFRNGPLAVEGYPGYYYIPFATYYALNEQGECLSLLSGEGITWTMTQQNGTRRPGYRYRKVTPDSGFTAQLYRHRAMMLTFRRYDASVVEMTVNHKNGIKGDDWLDNLEWATYKENNNHARINGLCDGKAKPIKIFDYNRHTERHFKSIAEAERAYPHVAKGRFKWWVENPPKRIPECNLYIKHAFDNTPWPEWKLGDERRIEDVAGIPIIALNMVTGEKRVYSSVTAAGKDTKTSWITVRRHCDKRVVPVKQAWCFRYADDVKNMPELTSLPTIEQ